MTQAIVNNAAAISFDRDLTVAQTLSQSRRLKWFRKGPIQAIAEVQMNVMRRETYQSILAALTANILGPYTLTFPEEVVGVPITASVSPNAPNQVGTSISVSGPATTTPILAGTIIQFPNHSQTYISTTDVTLDGVGDGLIILDQPLFSSPIMDEDIRGGTDVMFSMHLVNRPRASFGPTGLVNHDGPFLFAEAL